MDTINQEQKAALEPALKKFLGEDTTAAVLAQLDDQEDLRTALRSAGAEPPAGDNVRLVYDLAEAADFHIPLLVALLRLEPAPTSLRDVARHHYDSATVVYALEPPALAAYQTRLFSVEPTAVLLGLVSGGVIPTGDEQGLPEVKALVERVLSDGLLSGYRIDRESLKKLFDESKDLLKQAEPAVRAAAESFLKTLQRLQALVRLPHHVAALVDAHFHSARSIVDCSIDDFVTDMESRGLEAVAALRIYDQATTVELQNEQMWALGLQQRNDRALARVVPSTIPEITADPEYSADEICSLLAAGGTTRYDVLKTFQSPERVLGQYGHLQDLLANADRASELRALARTLLARSLAAEALNLQQSDYKAICGKAFYPVELWLACQTTPVVDVVAEYKSAMDIPSVAQLWGYADTEDMLDETRTKGLTFIKVNLLPRAGITIQELHTILQTQHMGRRLVVTSGAKDGSFSKTLDDMRLRLTLLTDADSGTLTEEVCRDLQSFIRLWKKIAWQIAELDSILSTLRRNTEDGSTTSPMRFGWGITPELLEELAAVKHISDLTGLSPAALQPLWGTIDTNGPESLYSRLFLQKRLLTVDPVFRRDGKTGLVLTGLSESIERHKAAILTTLQIPEQHFPTILSCAGLSITSDLSLASLSKIYCTSLVCRLFDIKPDQYAELGALLPGANLLSSPTDTLAALTKVRTLLDRGWILPDLTRVVGGGLSEKETQAARKAAARLQAGVVALDDTYATTPSNLGLAPPDAVTKTLTLLFPPPVAPGIHALIEGSQKFTAVAEVPASTQAQIPESLASRLTCMAVLSVPDPASENTTTPDVSNKQIRLTLTGILTTEEKGQALSLVPNDKNWVSAVEKLWKDSRRHLEILVRRVSASGGDDTTKEKKTDIPAETEKVFAGAQDTSTNERRLWFLQHTAPVLKTQLRQQLVVESVSSDFSVDNSLLVQVLTRVVRLGEKEDQNAFDAMKSVRITSLASDTFSGLFMPPLSETYRFVVNAEKKPEASINGQALEFTETGGAQWESDGVALVLGTTYTLATENFPFMSSGFVAGEAQLPSAFTADLLLDRSTDQVVQDMYRQLSASCKVVQVLGLDADAVSLFSSSSAENSFLRNITVDGLLHLQEYQSIQERTTSSGNKRQDKLSDFFAWVRQPSENMDDDGEVYDRLIRATSWSAGPLKAILSSKYPNWSAKDVRARFRAQEALAELAGIYHLLQGLKHLTLEPELLFRIATPELVDAASRAAKDPGTVSLETP